MNLPEFKIEAYFAKWEQLSKYFLCSSDMERFSQKEILDFADKECLNLWDNLHLGYTETKGLPLLRQEISKRYLGTNADYVQTFAGAEEGIYCTMRALLTQEDHVIVITPCYQSLETLPRTICKDVTALELDPERNWELDLAQVEQSLKPHTRMIVINYPHNPTGAILKKEKLEQLVMLAKEHDLYLFSDEVYRYLEINENDRLPAIAELYEKGISLSVMSKIYGLGGLRIGWIVCPDFDTLEKIAAYKHYLSLANSAPSEILALIALRNHSKIMERNHGIIKKNLALLDDFFIRKKEHFSWVRPKSGPIGFVKILSEIDSDEYCQEVLKQTGILLLPASVYDYSGSYFRIGFGRKNMPAVLEKFEAFIDGRK